VSDHIGKLEPAGVEYVMEDVVRLELKLGRTTLVIMGPEAETDNARMLVEGARDLFIQVVTKEQEKRDAEDHASHGHLNDYDEATCAALANADDIPKGWDQR
jgi:hypothetical protein